MLCYVTWCAGHVIWCDVIACVCCVMSRDALRCHVMCAHVKSCYLLFPAMGWNVMRLNCHYSKQLLCTTKYYSSTTPRLLCTSKYYSSTTPTLLQYYSVLQTTPVLQSTTPVLQRTTLYYKVRLQYYSSTTPYYNVLLQYCKVLLQYYCVLQSITPVLQRTTPVLLRTTKYYSSTTTYYSVLQSTTPVLLHYYNVLQSTTPVLLCTTKYYSSTTPVLLRTTKYYSSTPYYKVLLQYYCVLQSTTPYYKVLLEYYCVLQSTTPVLQRTTPVLQRTTPVLQSTTPVLLCTTKYYSSTTTYYSSTTPYYKVLFQYYCVLLCTTKCHSSTTKYYSSTTTYYSVLQSTTLYYFERSFPMRGATGISLQSHQILRLPRKRNVMIDPSLVWNVIYYNAQSNRHHHATSPNTAPATQKECHDWSASHMKRHLQSAERQASPCNLTKYCACHTKGMSWLIRITYETSFTMRGATGITLQPHQILRRPRKRNVMIDPHHIWNVIYNAQSDRHHLATSPNTAPATQNCTPKS